MGNALAAETSPYLLQHAENPVDWLPWGPQALARAKELDRPILLSIGYSSCHWCHVMERESFEDARTAAVMNESFVCVKVDREERPDVDALYMEAVQSMTGRGGWPLNVFLTPEQVPFYGGTYFPPEPRHGMPAWTQVLQAIAESWEHNREEIAAAGERLREHLGASARLEPSSAPLAQDALARAVANVRGAYDPVNGGFGGGAASGPRFPQASVIELLLARGEHEIALATLRAMATGGIHDQLGGGFARYSVDAAWAVPHFEKMLYDNALLARAYLHGWQASGEERLLEVCLGTLSWALEEMRGPEGGFYSALDADSEGVEGRYYVWRAQEIEDALGADAPAAIAWLGVSAAGNFSDPHHPEPGLNVLSARGPEPDAQTRERIRARLLELRARRVRPGLDDKRLTAWNALMIAALADAGATLSLASTPVGSVDVERTRMRTADCAEEVERTRLAAAKVPGGTGARLLDAATRCAEFVLTELRDEDGRLLRTYRDGSAKIAGYLEDHAFMLEALLVLFEASCEERWLEHARQLAQQIVERFADAERGGFFSTASQEPQLIARRKDLEDSPIPSGSSSAAMGLLRLAQITGEETYERHARSTLALLYDIAPRHPLAFAHVLQAMHWELAPARPIACAVPNAALKRTDR